MKQIYFCDYCGKLFERDISKTRGRKHLFCCRQCVWDYSSKTKNPDGYTDLKDFTNMSRHLTELNLQTNPTRMTPETKEKLRNHRLGCGEGKSYTKLYGRHEHRVIAEYMLGRELLPDEIVHHIDGNPRNNAPENLFVFSSQSEHAAHHQFLKLVLS